MDSKEEAIKRVLEGTSGFNELPEQEKSLFDGEGEIQDLQKVLMAADQWEVPEKTDIDSSWNQILNKTEATADMQQFRWLPIAASISIILLAGYFIFSFDNRVMINSNVGEIKEVVLPDGSSVTLNALSSITYEENWEEKRKVWLKGKARFNVIKGSTFEVVTEQFITTVLGTSFDVSYVDDGFNVSCYEGKVEVSDGSQRQILTVGEQATLEKGLLIETMFDVNSTKKWTNGEFYFRNAPFEKVVSELARQFDLEINDLPDDDRRYKGYFYKDDLIEALDLVFKPMGYDYTLEGKIVTVK